jgi:hypothetical protein
VAKKGALDADVAEVTVAEVRALLEVAMPLPPLSKELRMTWSQWRRRRRQDARRSYYRRTAAKASPITFTHAQKPKPHLRL